VSITRVERRIGESHPDGDQDDGYNQSDQNRTLKPELAVLKIKAHLYHVSHEIRLPAEFLAHASPDGGLEGTVSSDEGSKCCEREICDG
jgi:hypothetical protein